MQIRRSDNSSGDEAASSCVGQETGDVARRAKEPGPLNENMGIKVAPPPTVTSFAHFGAVLMLHWLLSRGLLRDFRACHNYSEANL